MRGSISEAATRMAEHQRLRQRGRKSGADDAQSRHAELAEDQRVIGKSVEARGDDAGDQRRARTLERGEHRTRGERT